MEAIDLTPSSGLGPCDRCERIKLCGWFGSFWLCEACVKIATEAIGLEAAGRAIERLARWWQEGKLHAGTRSAA